MKVKKLLMWWLVLCLILLIYGCAKVKTEDTKEYVGKYNTERGIEILDYPGELIFRNRIEELERLGFFEEHPLKEFGVDGDYLVFIWQYRRETNISRLPIEKITIIPVEEKIYSLMSSIKFKFNINSIFGKKEYNLKDYINSQYVVSATIRINEKDLQEKSILGFQ